MVSILLEIYKIIMKYSLLRVGAIFAAFAFGVSLQAQQVGFTSTSVSVNEDVATVTLTVARTGLAVLPASVNFATASGTATSGVDFTAASGTLNWGIGETDSKTITITLADDSVYESPSETFGVALSTPVGVTISSSSATVTIVDNESLVGVGATTTTVSETAGTVSIPVYRSGSTAQAASVNYTTVAGTATAGSDYVTTSGTLNWAVGDSATKNIVVTLSDDTAFESTETFGVTLSSPSAGANLSPSETTATVNLTSNDDDLEITSSTGSLTPAFGSTVTLSATFTGAASLTAQPISYTWTRGGTAIIAGGRYAFASSGTSSDTTTSLVISDVNSTDNGSYTLVINNGRGEPVSFSSTVTVTQAEATRDPGTTALGISSSSNSVAAILNLPDGRNLVAVKGAMSGSSSTSVNFANYGIAIVGADGRVSAAGAGNFNNIISALYRLENGKVLVIGRFTSVGGVSGAGRYRVARLNADFTLDTTFVPSPSPATLATGEIDTVVTDDQDRIYLGGNFSGYGGVTGYDALVRLFSDGALDRSFTRSPVAGSDVNALIRQTDGKIIVSGDMDSLTGDGLTVRSIYRLNADGTLDVDFSPPLFTADGTGLSFVATALDSAGRIYIAKTRGLYRLLSTGALDTAFVASIVPDENITQVLPMPDGKVLVGGKFTNVSFDGVSATASRLIRLNVDGTRDSSYGVGAALNANSTVTLLSRSAGGRIWAAGDFTTYSSAAANRILVLEGTTPTVAIAAQPQGKAANAGSSASFTVAATGDNGFTYAWFKDGDPLTNGGRISGATSATLTITSLADSDSADYSVVVTTPSEESVTSELAPLAVISAPEILVQPVGDTVDIFDTATFTVVARGGLPLTYQWLFEGDAIPSATSATYTIASANTLQAGRYSVRVTSGSESVVSDAVLLEVERRPGGIAADVPSYSVSGGSGVAIYSILRLADNTMLIGGRFTTVTVDGVNYARSNIARFLANGSIDTSFTPTFNNTVRVLAQDSAGRVFVGGEFTSVTFGSTTSTRNRIARLTSLLALDTAFSTSAGGPNGNVLAVAPVGDGSVYVGGAFTAVDGSASGQYVALLGATGARDTSFTSGAAATVNALLFMGSTLYVGGDSNIWAADAGGGSARLVKLSAAGVRQSFTSPSTATSVKSLLLLADGSLAVGSNVSPFLRIVDASTGVEVSPAYAITGHDAQVGAIFQQSDAKIISGSQGVIKRTNTSGLADNGFAEVQGGLVSAISVDSSDRIWVGGTFTDYNNIASAKLVVLAGGVAELSQGALQAQTVTFPVISGRAYSASASTVTLGATASSGLPITYSVVSGPATVSSSTLTITGAGTIVVKATQGGNSTYAAASATVSFSVAKANQTITFPDIEKRKTTSPAFELNATTSAAGLTVQYEVSGVATLGVDGKTLTLTGAVGTVTVKATQPGDANTRAANPVTKTFAVDDVPLKAQTITFRALSDRTFGTAPAVVNASVNVKGRTPTLTITSGSEFAEFISGGKLKLNGAGTVVITATEPGDADYAAATPVSQTLVIKKAPQNINFPFNGNVTLGNAAPTLNATASSGLAVTYAAEPGATAGTLSGGVITITGAGKMVIVASQAGNENYLPAKDSKVTLTVKTPALVLTNLNYTYDGQPHAATVSGMPSGFTPVVTYQLGNGVPTNVPPTDAGKYTVVASVGAQTNKATLTIAKKTLTATPGNKTILVGSTIPTGVAAAEFFTVSYSGFVDGEDEEVLDTPPVFSTTAKVNSKQGTYPITLSGGLDNNYAYSFGRGTLTVVGLAGTYEAAIIGTDERPLGWLTLTMLNNSFGYTGTLSLINETNNIALKSDNVNPILSGELSEGVITASGTWSRAGGALPALSLQMSISSTGALTGSLTRGGNSFGFLANGRLLRSTSVGTAGVGAYSLILAAVEPESGDPEGAGVATLSINSSGLATIRGSLADGTKLSAAVKMDDQNGYRLFVKPYGDGRVGNMLAGQFQLEASSLPSSYRVVSADIAWIKPSNSADRSYRNGINVDLDANIELWTKSGPAKNLVQLLGITSAPNTNGVLGVDFINSSLTEAQLSILPTTTTLLPNNTVLAVLAAENPTGFNFAVNSGTTTTGVVNGTFKLVVLPTTTVRTISYSAMLRQPLSGDEDRSIVGRGYFLLPGAQGSDPSTSGEIRFLNPSLE